MRDFISMTAGPAARLLVAFAAFWLLPAAPTARAEPVLREQIRVYSDLVTLGDLFDDAGPARNAPVFRAPDLGTHGIVAAKRIAAAARRHGLFWDNPGAVEQVTVERPGRLVSLEEIRKAIARHAAKEMDGPDAKALAVTLERRAREFHVNPRIGDALVVKRFHLRPETGDFDATVGFESNAYRTRDRGYRGRIEETIEVAVPARAIERGDTIREADVKTLRLPVQRLRAGVVTETRSLAGMAAKQRLPADQPVRRDDIEQPKLITRNALVTIVYEVPGLSLKTQGRAQADAASGATVAVLNTRSNRVVQATVRGPGVVVVETPTHAAPAPRAAYTKPAGVAGPPVVR